MRSNGSGEKKWCGVCTIAHLGSAINSPIVICRKERTGMWSQSKIATNSPCVCRSAELILPALACACSVRAR
ncbi:hypothetical protein D3C72_1735570 [compost metagenome]